MKVLKTVVATAVIVFALTTVAIAGVQHLGRAGADATSAGHAAQATAQQTQTAAQSAAPGGVTLSARQFAALLRAVDGSGSQDRASTRAHGANQGRAQKSERTGTHARRQSQSHAASGSAGSRSSAGTTQHTAVHHTQTLHTTAHHTATHTTSHGGGTDDGGSHGGDGGCD